jgi:hypothetical protein
MEKWKNIKGYENYYQISNAGNIRSKDRIIINSKGRKSRYKSKERKPSFSEYRLIALSKNGITKVFKISRLVAIHFIEKKDGKGIVNHIDGNKYNDNVSNLEWCSYSENAIHSFDKGLSKSKNKIRGVFFEERRNKWTVYLYRNNKNIFIGRFNSEKEAMTARKKYLNDHKY